MNQRSDNVLSAFDLILDELTLVIADVNKQGADYLGQGEYEAAAKAIEAGKKLLSFCNKLDILRNAWENDFDLTIRNRVQLSEQSGFLERSPKSAMIVRFVDGTIIDCATAAETFVRAIEHIGLERVKNLGMVLNKHPLVSQYPDKNYSQIKSGAFFVGTHASNLAKKRLLEEIAGRLKIKMEISVHRYNV
jgi:hypothetical protein